MPEPRKKLDLSQLAKSIVDQAVGDAPKAKQPPSVKQKAGAKGGAVGGKKRMEAMDAEQRRSLAMLGVEARKAAPGPQAGAVTAVKGKSG